MEGVRRPSKTELRRAARLLAELASRHGLSSLRLGGPGELVVDVTGERGYFAVVAFEDEVEHALGWRPEVISAGAPGARPGPPLVDNTSTAA